MPTQQMFDTKIACGVSFAQRQALQAIADQRRVPVAAVARWAIEVYLAKRRKSPSTESPGTSAVGAAS
jgi:hypothetical protein